MGLVGSDLHNDSGRDVTRDVAPSAGENGKMPRDARIALVDDGVPERKLNAIILKLVGGFDNITQFTFGGLFLLSLRENPVDVLLLDNKLGDYDGPGIIKEMKAMGIQLPIIIILSASSLSELTTIFSEFLNEGTVAGIITRPFMNGNQAFIDGIDEAWRKHQRRIEAEP
jgi:FixJ family two-component response regulator